MKGLLIYAAALLYSVPAHSASEAFHDAFRAFVKARQLEEQVLILEQQAGWDEILKKAEKRKLEAKLTEARIDFHAILDDEHEELSPWEKNKLAAVGKFGKKTPAPEPAPALAELFPQARAFSPLEWQVVREWFGDKSQESFLRETYAAETLPPTSRVQSRSVVWISDPFVHLLSPEEKAQLQDRQQAARQQLEKEGYAVREISLSLFSRAEDQAEELRLELMKVAERDSFVILSSGRGSAVLMRTFDLNPALLSHPAILGWLNLNGQLYGAKAEKKTRAPASIEAANRQVADSQQQLLLFHREGLERQPPLSAKFPVVNLVSAAGKARPAKNLRESLVPEGKTYLSATSNAWSELRNALTLFPARQR